MLTPTSTVPCRGSVVPALYWVLYRVMSPAYVRSCPRRSCAPTQQKHRWNANEERFQVQRRTAPQATAPQASQPAGITTRRACFSAGVRPGVLAAPLTARQLMADRGDHPQLPSRTAAVGSCRASDISLIKCPASKCPSTKCPAGVSMRHVAHFGAKTLSCLCSSCERVLDGRDIGATRRTPTAWLGRPRDRRTASPPPSAPHTQHADGSQLSSLPAAADLLAPAPRPHA